MILIAYKIPLARFLRGNHRRLKLHRRREKTNSKDIKASPVTGTQ